jgi:hypothetical protein
MKILIIILSFVRRLDFEIALIRAYFINLSAKLQDKPTGSSKSELQTINQAYDIVCVVFT